MYPPVDGGLRRSKRLKQPEGENEMDEGGEHNTNNSMASGSGIGRSESAEGEDLMEIGEPVVIGEPMVMVEDGENDVGGDVGDGGDDDDDDDVMVISSSVVRAGQRGRGRGRGRARVIINDGTGTGRTGRGKGKGKEKAGANSNWPIALEEENYEVGEGSGGIAAEGIGEEEEEKIGQEGEEFDAAVIEALVDMPGIAAGNNSDEEDGAPEEQPAARGGRRRGRERERGRGRGRRRGGNNRGDDAGEGNGNGNGNVGNANANANPNPQDAARERFREIARRRAAHFAHFAGDEDGGDVAAGAGANAPQAQAQGEREREDWPGPFSTARRLVEGRDAAAAARREAAGQAGTSKASSAASVVQWSPSRKPCDPAFEKRPVPSLHHMCIELLCDNVEHVVSLDCVPEATKKRVSAGLCSRRKMTPDAAGLFFANEPVEVQVPDCSLINEADLTSHMAQCVVERLQVLELGFCGRGLSTQCLTSTIATGPGNLPMLTTVSFRGAYRLSDQGVAALVDAAPNLTSLDLTQCSLLSIASVKSVGDILGQKLKSFSLEGCDKLDAMQLLPILLQMTNLQKLSLSGVGGMKDEIVSELAVTLGPNLEELRLADCRLLTDVAIAGVAACCPGLKVLDLDALPHLTDTAIGRIADGCRSLQKIYLKRAKVTDEAVAAFVMASGSALLDLSLNSARQVGDLTLLKLATHAKSLELLDVSWCRSLSDQALGFLADACDNLRELRVFGCTQITKHFTEGHTNSSLKVIGFGHEKLYSEAFVKLL